MQERFVPMSETGYLLSGTIEGTSEAQGDMTQAPAQQHDPSTLPQAANYPGYFNISYDQPGPSTSIEMAGAVPCHPPGVSYYHSQVPQQQHQHQHYYGYSEMMPPVPYQEYTTGQINQPEINILIQPTNRMRFRYGSEKGSHGVLTGNKDKKSFPTVKLENYIIGDKCVFIRASLYTNDKEPRLHVHRFKGPHCKDGTCVLPIDKESMTAVFQNLSIEFVGKKEVTKVLHERKLRSSNIPPNQYASVEPSYDTSAILETAKEEANKMNLNVVRICFEVVVQGAQGQTFTLGQKVFSELIYNQKATETGELKIVRMDKCSGSCAGGDEIFLLCDKVNKKDIKIQFYEEKNGQIVWEDWGQFTEADVHYQVAIVFTTPPYCQDISEAVEVLIRLFRLSDHETSDPRKFKYLPKEQDKEGVETKRRKVAYSGYRSTEGMSSFKSSPSSPYSTSTSSVSSGEFGSQKKNESGGMEGTSMGEEQELLEFLDGFDIPLDDNEGAIPNYPLRDTSCNPLLSFASIFNQSPNMLNVERYPRTSPPSFLHSDSVCAEGKLQDAMENLTIRESTFSPDVKTNQSAVDKEHLPPIMRKTELVKSSEQSIADLKKEILGKLQPLIEVCIYKFGYGILKELQKQTKQGKALPFLLALQSFLIRGNKHGNNALHQALINKDENDQFLLKLIEVIKNAPGDIINSTNNANQTALHLAAQCRKSSCVMELLCAGANQNLKDKNGDTAIHIAAYSGDTECLEMLLSFGYSNEIVKLNDLNYSGKAPLHLAVEKSHEVAVELLCKAGVDVNIADGKSGKTPLHYAARSSITIVNILLKQHKIQVSLQDYGGNTPLHFACLHGSEDIVSQLMQNKANPLIKNNVYEVSADADEASCEEGKTAYDYADNNEKIIAILNGKYDKLSLSSQNSSNTEISSTHTLRSDTPLPTKCDQKPRFKVTSNPNATKATEGKNLESIAPQCDSGYESREIQFLDNSLLKELCRLLDPPSNCWEKLAEFLVDKAYLKRVGTKKSPTKTMLRLYKGTIEEFMKIVELTGLTDVLKLLQGYTATKIPQES